MAETYFLLFDTGISDRYPGFPPDFFFSGMPVAGSFSGLEVSVANMAAFPEAGCCIITPAKRVKMLQDQVKDWSIEIDLLPYEDDLLPVFSFLEKKSPRFLIIQNMLSLVSLDSAILQKLTKSLTDRDLLKCSVDGVPVELFVAAASFFSDFTASITEGGEKLSAADLFKYLLLHFTDLPEIPGTVFLHNTLYGMYQTYQKCIGARHFFHPALYRLYERKPKDSEIGKNGAVSNSLFAPGSRIDGNVKNSFIFEDVSIREGASVENSIIFPGHTIGKKSVIKNSVVLPFTLEPSPGTTIGDKSIIGGKSRGANKVFPEHIQSGVSVIGFNTEVPPGTVIEPASCIDWNVAKSELKENRVIKKGSYITSKG